MGTMAEAIKKAANTDKRICELLVQGKIREIKEKEVKKEKVIKANLSKKVYIWKGHHDKYELHGGIIFADNLDEATNILIARMGKVLNTFDVSEVSGEENFYHTFTYIE